jgi:MoxR-like ATPase
VIPDDVKALTEPVLVHRVIRTTDAELSDRSVTEIIRAVVDSVAPPSADASFAEPDGRQPQAADGGSAVDDRDSAGTE